MSVRLQHPAGMAEVEPLGDGEYRITVELADPGYYMPVRACVTHYSMSLIARVLEVKGPAYLCHEILRSEDSRQIQREFEYNLLAFVEPAELAHARVLDFACGCGASTAVLCRMFPDAQIVGVDLDEKCLDVARMLVAEFRGGALSPLAQRNRTAAGHGHVRCGGDECRLRASPA